MERFGCWLRYYSPAFEKNAHGSIVRMCDGIWNKHSLRTEIVKIRLVPALLNKAILVPDQIHQEALYYSDFMPRWRVLNARTGTRMRKVLRSNSGAYFVAGVVAIVSDQGLEWYAVPGDSISEHDQDYRVRFLAAVFATGPGLLAELCRPVERVNERHSGVDN
jgi:hypothetical protein